MERNSHNVDDIVTSHRIQYSKVLHFGYLSAQEKYHILALNRECQYLRCIYVPKSLCYKKSPILSQQKSGEVTNAPKNK